MTDKEFIYWLNGFVDAIQDQPTPKQFEMIKEKLKTIGALPVNIMPIRSSPQIPTQPWVIPPITSYPNITPPEYPNHKGYYLDDIMCDKIGQAQSHYYSITSK